ncbi:hypothetical protein HGM15179_012156, partial [Zosterops borbonicus]
TVLKRYCMVELGSWNSYLCSSPADLWPRRKRQTQSGRSFNHLPMASDFFEEE